MVKIEKTGVKNPDFIQLVKQLDVDLAERDGKEHLFYDQYNKIAAIKYVVVAYEMEQPVGCGAIKAYGPNTMEVKRMFVVPQSRRQGVAGIILSALENWAAALTYQRCILETGKNQPEAIGLYLKNGYKVISNYGQYANVENSICFEKEVKHAFKQVNSTIKNPYE